MFKLLVFATELVDRAWKSLRSTPEKTSLGGTIKACLIPEGSAALDLVVSLKANQCEGGFERYRRTKVVLKDYETCWDR